MMQFDIDMTYGKNKASSDEYLTMLANDYFYVAKDKTVLEFASHIGAQTSALLYNNPKKIICVEPDPMSTTYDIFKNPLIDFFSGTANDYYRTVATKVDVVTCFGLLYHMHSPFHLIEQIVNYSDPEHIIIETLPVTHEQLVYNFEEPGLGGNIFADTGLTKPLRLNIEFNYKYMYKAITESGYRIVKEDIYNNKYDVDAKRGAAITLFEKL